MQETRANPDRRLREIDALASKIGQNSALCNTLDHERLTALRRFDELGGWAEQGARSCAHWLSWRIGLGPGAAREQVRVALALGALHRIDAAFGRAELSYSQVRALTRVASAENEASLLELARHSTAAQIERICRSFQTVVDPSEAAASERYVRRRDLESGMVRLDVVLLPEEAAVVMKALEVAVRLAHAGADVPAGTPTRADALVSVCEAFLADAARGAQVPSRFEVSVHVSAETLAGDEGVAELEDGSPVAAETSRRLSCDAAVVEDGRRTRRVHASLRRTLERRDRGCRFPGCTNKIWVDAHHIEHWAHGGPTALENLVTLCRFHHILLHEGGVTIDENEAELVFLDRQGRKIEAVPPTDRLAASPEDVEASVPRWDGSPLDLPEAVDALLSGR
jgi:hypothetical protein